MGGWAQVYNTRFVETREFFELDSPVNEDVQKIVVVSDKNGKVVGVYPRKGFDDIISILGQLPQLADIEQIYGKTEI